MFETLLPMMTAKIVGIQSGEVLDHNKAGELWLKGPPLEPALSPAHRRDARRCAVAAAASWERARRPIRQAFPSRQRLCIVNRNIPGALGKSSS